jgi:hypothetical protein
LAARVLGLVERELAHARDAASRARTETATQLSWTRRHGVLPQADRASLRLGALATVIVPCMHALCASVAGGAARHVEAENTVVGASLSV